jgi:hypothetical protein
MVPARAFVQTRKISSGKNGLNIPGKITDHENSIHVITAPDIGSLSLDQFRTDFGKVNNASWRKTVHFDEVSFSKNGKAITAYYDEEGNLIGTTRVRTFNELPPEGQRQIKEEYKGYTIGPVILFRNDNISPDESKIYGPQYRYDENYFVEMTKGKRKIVVQVNPVGTIYYFRSMGSAIG